MARLLSFLLTFVVGLSLGSLTSGLEKSAISPIPTEVSISPTAIDFFEHQPADQLATDAIGSREIAASRKTPVCTDQKILPIWRTLMRDKDTRNNLPAEVDCRNSMEIKYADLNGDLIKEVLVRGNVCGATGNCAFWVLRKHRNGYRILLHYGDNVDYTKMGDQVLRNRTKGFRDILLKGHFSVSETSYTTFRFNGRRYIETKCLFETPKVRNGEKTTWHFITCKEFERQLDEQIARRR